MPTDQTIIDKLERADGPDREMSGLTQIALRNLLYYLKHADFKNGADRLAAMNCFEVIEAELNAYAEAFAALRARSQGGE